MPLLPRITEAWSGKVARLLQETARLDSALPGPTRRSLVPLLRLVNCYYSNLIEGHRTLPADIERAMDAARVGAKPQQQLACEAVAHLQVQELVEAQTTDPTWTPTDPTQLRWMHQAFMERLPEDMRWAENAAKTTRVAIVPGELRTRHVQVGVHDPPAHAALPAFLQAFHQEYRQHTIPSSEGIARIAAAHQRFAWIHPFLDGNGRVGRLMTDAMFARAGLGCDGLWRITRGFARRVGDYKGLLQAADQPRAGDLDGRCNLTQQGLDDWCSFVVDTAIDQVMFMRGILSVERLPARIQTWAAETYPATTAAQIGLLVERVIRYGSVDRSTAGHILGVTERHARRIIDQLASARVITAPPRGDLGPAFPISAVPRWFPDLFPLREDEGMRTPPHSA